MLVCLQYKDLRGILLLIYSCALGPSHHIWLCGTVKETQTPFNISNTAHLIVVPSPTSGCLEPLTPSTVFHKV